ncbi:hypothetical protein H5410_004019 [Solanum commersonii]|uniref:Uncharacterized protein n=1 Tax=Solanum commersonii TaxID=4109 RepID=A0A9J6B6G0_SOLCO|nr:hypothetical protein H5410_004019 [Solanum commersonii]
MAQEKRGGGSLHTVELLAKLLGRKECSRTREMFKVTHAKKSDVRRSLGIVVYHPQALTVGIERQYPMESKIAYLNAELAAEMKERRREEREKKREEEIVAKKEVENKRYADFSPTNFSFESEIFFLHVR